MTRAVKDIAEADFQAEVIERSGQVPVVVDFWAPWCGPCKTLGPLLEQAVAALGGRVVMVKINTDANPNIAAQFGIQGIPNVKAFRNGAVVDEFVGALPASAIAQFLARLVPSASQEALATAMQHLASGHPAEAEHVLRGLLGDEEAGSAAAFFLAHLLVGSGGGGEEIRALADKIHPSSELYARVEAVEALAQLVDKAHAEGPQAAQAALAADPKNHEAAMVLAASQLVRGQTEAALESLLTSVSRNPNHADGAARKAMLAIFDHLELPPAKPDVIRHYRRQLQIVT